MAADFDAAAPAELLDPVRVVLPHDEVHLRHSLDMDQVEQGPPGDCAADRIHITGELRSKRPG
ncbi:MAG: hypothetical protein A3F70_01170 [Acidobacteria bacterium RIFCSPLOWO2_12_FULL_67_14]|nr:MAG: hypothetical protein A3H29_12305 [Acidobacteria bacterium RIFCSPLOWO2_02_FULL_67_21]OFW38411.1 MAG: hypothetical protein A3F70_01170 [Acidobacteria bacterium RIFCSPLOWO2_12_FULL_67_14]